MLTNVSVVNNNVAMLNKRCTRCALKLPLSAFNYSPKYSQGVSLYCRSCVSAQYRTKTEICIDCGGVRSYGSGKRCKGCYLKYAAAVQLEKANYRLERQAIREQRSKERSERLLRFQPHSFRLRLAKVVSLDAPIFSAGRPRVLADVVADKAPNVLERMIESEGVARVIQRLCDERKIPWAQAKAIVDAIVDSDFLADGSVYDLADNLRSKWQADRLLTAPVKQFGTLATAPTKLNPEPSQYEHWRRKDGLARSGRVITREVEVERFGGAWSIETALPEELRENVA